MGSLGKVQTYALALLPTIGLLTAGQAAELIVHTSFVNLAQNIFSSVMLQILVEGAPLFMPPDSPIQTTGAARSFIRESRKWRSSCKKCGRCSPRPSTRQPASSTLWWAPPFSVHMFKCLNFSICLFKAQTSYATILRHAFIDSRPPLAYVWHVDE